MQQGTAWQTAQTQSSKQEHAGCHQLSRPSPATWRRWGRLPTLGTKRKAPCPNCGVLNPEANLLTKPQTVILWTQGGGTLHVIWGQKQPQCPLGLLTLPSTVHSAVFTAISRGSGKVGRSRDQHALSTCCGPQAGHTCRAASRSSVPGSLGGTASGTPLGYQNPRTPQPLVYNGAVFAYNLPPPSHAL